MSTDSRALHGLLAYVEDAIDRQPTNVADQLRAALHEGRTVLRFREIGGDVHAVVEIDGYEVAAVDVRNLVPLDDL